MTHYSVVADGPFQQIKNGERLIEPRLNDKAHKAIRPGDLIVLTNRSSREEIITKVVGVLRYPSFVELLQAYPAARFGADDDRVVLTEMRRYYTPEQEMTHGVLGIKLHILRPTHGG